MYQLTQAMAAGKLQGDEFRSIMENAPMLAQAIAAYTGKSMGELKEMSSEGLITADIIKNAMFAAADETNAKFAELPMTFAQVWTVIQNSLIQAFEPLIQTIGKGAQWIYDNWSTLQPIFLGLAAAVGVYALMTGIQTAATWLSVAANRALAVSLLTNPIGWIALAIGVLIGFIYKWVKSVGGIQIAWQIAMSAILTAWDWVKIGFFTGIYYVLGLWDLLKLGIFAAAVGIANFMGDMKTNVLVILQNMVNGAIGIINDFINILNKIPGVSISAVAGVTFGTNAQIENEASKQSRNAALASYGSDIAKGIMDRDASIANMKSDARSATAKRSAEITAAQAEAAAKASQDSGFDSIYDNVADTAGNTAKMADSMETSEEDLKYLRDMAEQEAVNRFTTAEIKVDMPVSASIASNMDLDGVIDYLGEGIYEAMEVAAEGVHE